MKFRIIDLPAVYDEQLYVVGAPYSYGLQVKLKWWHRWKTLFISPSINNIINVRDTMKNGFIG